MAQRFRKKTGRAWITVLSLVLAMILFHISLQMSPPAVTADTDLQGLTETEAAPEARPGLIALTFDDGPRRSTTTALLDGLAQRGVHATFFLIGSQIEENRDVVRRMDMEGHQVGIHTFDHVNLTGLNQRDFDAQVRTTRDLLSRTLDHEEFMLRPPYGLYDDTVKTRAGCPIILWSIDPEDWKYRDTSREVEHIVSRARAGSIILLHDIYPESVEAALQVVDQLHTKGFMFCTIEELFDSYGIPLQPGKVYTNAYP